MNTRTRLYSNTNTPSIHLTRVAESVGGGPGGLHVGFVRERDEDGAECRALEPGEEIRVFPLAYLVEGVLPARREASDDCVITESQTEGGEVEGLCCVDRHVDGREFRLVLGCARVGEAGPCYLQDRASFSGARVVNERMRNSSSSKINSGGNR